MTLSRRWFTTALLASTVPGSALAQSDYPNKPVRIVIDSAAGSANDAALRILGDRLSKIWNQQVVTLNQPGAGGGISARVASEAPNDGYTLYMPATSPFLSLAGAPGVAPNLPIELPRDFAAIWKPQPSSAALPAWRSCFVTSAVLGAKPIMTAIRL